MASDDIRRYHIIEQGDTLASIAQRYGVTADDLLAVNPHIDVNSPHTWGYLPYMWLPMSEAEKAKYRGDS